MMRYKQIGFSFLQDQRQQRLSEVNTRSNKKQKIIQKSKNKNKNK